MERGGGEKNVVVVKAAEKAEEVQKFTVGF